ncbi:hypothetical protein CAPTEDRAFT_141241 [Capitella teleta]|uniref:Selenocysteine lyase n=1 Tax=Capitella teleta TaxID=283909 RepID=R7TEE7_CAPTE|nr:hypothetical protein CAPTEDRAFT_141241 [Capitella teleta]|eukprot:ELT92143.1 hypothetical protein CAPTEDRAFT_141241 [Capitella teleta]
MMANNETGVIQPIEDISRAVKALNHGPRQILMHTDAAQCIGKIPVRVPDLAVDYLTVVGHKFYGPRIGALYVRKPGSKTPLLPIFYGGGQERNFRSGTENTPMIAGLGMAAHLVCENLPRYQNMMKESRDQMEYMLRKLVTNSSNPGLGISINGKYASSQRLPNTLNFAFVGANSAKTLGRSVLEKVSDLQAGVGAACHSGSGVRASPVLLASGVPEEAARNAIRLSFGREEISVKDIQSIAERLCNAAESLQQASE